MNYAEDTKTLVTPNGDTDSMSARPFLSTTPLHKSMAHKILNEVKLGVYHHPVTVTQALLVTGDL